MKKYIPILLSVFLVGNTAFAQQRIVEKSFSANNSQKVELKLKFGETISVKAWDKQEVSFKATININRGKLNDALELDFDEQGNMLEIASTYNREKMKAGRPEDCPDRYSRSSWSSDDEGHYVVCSNISYEVYVPANTDLMIDTISGDIDLVDLTGPIRAKSISGYVDLSWPSNRPADIDMKTISGEAFTDIDELEFSNKKDHIPLVGYKINARIGNGGPRISLESISGNVYLRKARS